MSVWLRQVFLVNKAPAFFFEFLKEPVFKLFPVSQFSSAGNHCGEKMANTPFAKSLLSVQGLFLFV